MKLITPIVHVFILSCRKASALIVKKQEFGLNQLESTQLKWHKSMCQYCTAFEKQVEEVDELIRKTIEEELSGKVLSDGDKKKIREELQKLVK
ncbi:MAG: hypothetical protein GC180_01440 [Bacteroidetes bacterium]|nr:hypothetical protein [Bacteroidota bacterium]